MVSTGILADELWKGAMMMTQAQEALLLCEFIREKAGVRIEEFCGTPHCCIRPTGFDELWQLDLDVVGAFSETPDHSIVFGSQTSVFLALVPNARDVVKSLMWTMNMVSVLVVLKVEQSESLRQGVETYHTDGGAGAGDFVVGIVAR